MPPNGGVKPPLHQIAPLPIFWVGADDHLGEEIVLWWTQMGVNFQSPEYQKVNSGLHKLYVSKLTLLRGRAIMQQPTTRVNPSEETIKIGPIGIRFLLTGEDSNGSVSVFEVLVPFGQKLAAPAHKNDAYEEILYGIQGVLTWTVDGTPIEVGPGQALCIPRGAVHRFDNLGSEDVKQLAVITPAIMGPAYFREAAEVISAAAGGPPDRAKMMDVFRRHGMTVAPPPAK
jgi:quercetin dioxygenase-like cupin family protein